MVERDELARRYHNAQFHALASIAERQSTESNSQQPDSEPTAPTLAQIMGVQRQKDIGSGMADNDRLRRWAGLK